MRSLRHLLIGALLTLVVGGPPATASAVGGRAESGESGWITSLPEWHSGTSVAIGPDGAARFGVYAQEETELARVSPETLTVEKFGLSDHWGSTKSLHFDQEGNLWFLRNNARTAAVVRRAPDGTMTAFKLPGRGQASSLAIASDGEIWFTRNSNRKTVAVGRMTPTGAVTQFPLADESRPASIVPGPDGAFWFTEAGAGRIGRVTTSGEITLFPLGRHVEPHRIVPGPDGALWFTENGRPGRHGASSDRIGRITTSGEVTQFPIPFGRETQALAVDPRGFVWFTTDRGELSSISPSGTVGKHDCVDSCGTPIESIAVATGGAILFAGGHPDCSSCGGGSAQINENYGTILGKIPAGALAIPSDVS